MLAAHETVAQMLQRLEGDWEEVCETLNEQEWALVETYMGFLRRVAQVCLEKGWRVWFRPNQVAHWGEGGFGNLFILLPESEQKPHMRFPTEVRFLTSLPEGKKLGEEIALTTLDQIVYEPDSWR
jgi:hypothetical protein